MDKVIKLSNIILEFIDIARVCDSNLCVIVRETDHAQERSVQRRISPEEIESVVKQAISKLDNSMHDFSKRKEVFSTHGKYYYIKKGEINIVGSLHYDQDKKQYIFAVVTVVRRMDFHPRPDTEKIAL